MGAARAVPILLSVRKSTPLQTHKNRRISCPLNIKTNLQTYSQNT